MAIPGSDLLEVPTIYKAYFLGDIPRKYGQKYGTFTYLHFGILEWPLIYSGKSQSRILRIDDNWGYPHFRTPPSGNGVQTLW